MNWDIELPGSVRRDPSARRGGIYFWIRGDAVLYIGQTVCFETRIPGHETIRKEFVLPDDEIRPLYLENGIDLEAEGGARDIGYVIVCRKCSAAIDDHKRPGDCERFLKIKQEPLVSR